MPSSSTPSQSQNLKHRIFTCLTKLSDRDTQSIGASELESIARTLDSTSVPIFLSCIYSTDSSDKSPVRKQCVHLLTVLSQTHGNALSPYLSKILSNIVRRLRDPDSSVRSACVNSVSALSTHITKQPFSSFLKPLTEALFTEQDTNSQIGAAMCLAAAIDAAPEPEPAMLAKLLPRFEKLLKCNGFKAKPALLTVIGGVVEAGGASSHGFLRNLVPCVMEFLSSSDWAARKSAAEVLVKLAIVERDALSEFKVGCLMVFESRRFDKVKAVREVMNQMLDLWKQIPDVSDDISPPPHSQSSSKENLGDGRYTSGSKDSCCAGSDIPQPWRKMAIVSRSTPPDRTFASKGRKRSPLTCGDKRMNSGIFRKIDGRNWNIEISAPVASAGKGAHVGDAKESNENVPGRNKSEKNRLSKPEMKRALFGKKPDDKILKFGGSKTSSRIVPFQKENDGSVEIKDLHTNHKENEDLSLIRDQLSQIEKQQSSLMDLLQRFIGSSQNGMRSLETRVHGLELALDEISYDLAVSSGRMTKSGSFGGSCCLLRGAEFLSTKFWRKSHGQVSSSRFHGSNATALPAAMLYRSDNNNNEETLRSTNCRFQPCHGGAFIVNPLAEVHSHNSSRMFTEVPRD